MHDLYSITYTINHKQDLGFECMIEQQGLIDKQRIGFGFGFGFGCMKMVI